MDSDAMVMVGVARRSPPPPSRGVSRSVPQIPASVQQCPANSSKVPQRPAMLDVWDVQDVLDHLQDTHTRDLNFARFN
jgi:hypothetical protein